VEGAGCEAGDQCGACYTYYEEGLGTYHAFSEAGGGGDLSGCDEADALGEPSNCVYQGVYACDAEGNHDQCHRGWRWGGCGTHWDCPEPYPDDDSDHDHSDHMHSH
jgi:hypothetical protein